VNYPTLKAAELPDFLTKLAEVDTSPMNRLAVQLLMLTFVRTGEMRQAKWADIHWAEKEWVIPTAHTKMRREHVVPLAKQTLAVLEQLREVADPTPQGWLLPSQNRQKNPVMCENTINNVLAKMGFKGRLVGHGFRALASTILNEQGHRADVIERQLAHKEPNAIRAAYNRAEYLEERRTLMQAWADYLEEQADVKLIPKKSA
jgi:integrase